VANNVLFLGHVKAQAVRYLGSPARPPKFNPRLVNVGSVVEKVTFGQVFHSVLHSSSVNIIPPLLHAQNINSSNTNAK
jgi:hypothetical protein